MTEEVKVQRAGFIFDHHVGRLTDSYDVQASQLGQGTYGTVSKATNKSTGAIRAVKTMAKKDIKNEARFKAEISIMKKLDHPNIIKLFETFEDVKYTYLVLELCTGGELFDRIIDQGFFSEKGASILMKQILQAMHYCHSNNIMHRDLKPENFLFATKSPDSPLKVIDFGLAAMYEAGERMKTKAGTPYYVAPEVLAGNYGAKCDMWSCGVMMYIILCGYPPFYGDTDGQILRLVKLGTYDFPPEDWANISGEAKQLIQAMLTLNEDKRIAADFALQHSWIQKAPSNDIPLSTKVMSNFKTFRNQNRLKKIALTAIAKQLPESEIQQLKETFLAIDKNGDGTLTLQELTEGAAKHNVSLPPNFTEVFASLDSDGSGSIDYTEFIAGTMEKRVYMQEDLCWGAFRVFDQNNDGVITKDELRKVLGEMDGENSNSSVIPGLSNADKLIEEADLDGDGQIDFEEFMAMMRKG